MAHPSPYYSAHQPSPSSSVSSLPGYDAISSDKTGAAAGFSPTLSYQVESKGSQWLSLPSPPKPDPITVYAIDPDGSQSQKVYESIRPERRSGSCSLYAVGSERPVSSTTYRFGPGKPPVIHLHTSELEPCSAESASSASTESKGEAFEVTNRGATTRSVLMRTPLGTYQWRYGTRSERKACDAHSLLVLEKVTTIALASRKTKEEYTRVAQFIRNEHVRTHGTRRCDAGNGGRLMMDLRDGEKKSKELEVLVVTGLICMLKKEIDRRRAQKLMVMVVAAGGGSV